MQRAKMPEVTSDRRGMRLYFAAEHCLMAEHLSSRARAREDHLVATGAESTWSDLELRANTVAGIMESTAFLEARVNEVLRDAADDDPQQSVNLMHLAPSTVALLEEFGRNDRLERNLSTLDKYNLVLTCASQPRIDMSRRPGQDVGALFLLRNALVHFKPETQWDDDEEHRMERILRHLVPPSVFLADAEPWWPSQALTAGVAEWSCLVSKQLVHEWESAIRLPGSVGKELGADGPLAGVARGTIGGQHPRVLSANNASRIQRSEA
jgi:hypothetical protein